MRQFELKHTGGSYRDEISYYSLIPDKPGMTVVDLCEYAVKESNEWGYVGIISLGRPYKWLDHNTLTEVYRFEYSRGKTISDNIPEEIKNKPIKTAKASGGWSRMDHDLYGLL